MREGAIARQAALDEAAAERETILRRHYDRLREPEHAHRPTIEDAPDTAAGEHARRQRERHRAALTVARTTRAGAIPLRRPAAASAATCSGAA
ncbi:hypothetical protein [Kitasatospora herbaricolor]|uniref:Uncharacterized protein n=1 Tax=Kitasatospora herbaricolor TaxID=68217 RepID=A0ABZ1WJ93_9ACTN|nr:hypothetical protein [Kitasatospora herbaricolor]